MTTALYVRKGFEHRAPVTKEAFIEAWTLVCGIDQWQALDEFQEAVAYGDIYEVSDGTIVTKPFEYAVLDSHSWYISTNRKNTTDAPSTHFFQTTGADDVSYY